MNGSTKIESARIEHNARPSDNMTVRKISLIELTDLDCKNTFRAIDRATRYDTIGRATLHEEKIRIMIPYHVIRNLLHDSGVNFNLMT